MEGIAIFSAGLIALAAAGGLGQQESDAGFVAHWPFDEGEGTTARDATGNGHNGTLQDVTWARNGLVGAALRCDGGAVVVPPSDELTPTEQLTIELWFRTSNGQQSDQWIINTILGDDSKGYRLGFGGGRLAFQVLQTSWSHMLSSSLPTPVDEWCHAAATYDGSIMRLYLNGILVGRLERGGPVRPSGQPLHIGTFVAGHERAFYEGLLDEVKLYDRALSAEEVLANYARHVEEAAAAPVEPTWDFRRNLDGWRTWAGGLDHLGAGKAGQRLRVTAESGLLVGPPVSIDTESSGWATLRLRAAHGSLLQLGWVSDALSGLQFVSVPLIADGELHTYNIDLAAATTWSNDVSRLTLRPTNAAGSEVEFVSLRVGPQPAGPAELHIRWCGLEDPINRVGMACRVLCHIENRGGEPVRDLRMDVDWPEALSRIDDDRAPERDELATGEVVVMAAGAEAVKVGRGQVRITLASANCEPMRRAFGAEIGPKLDVKPAMIDGKPYVPEPQPVETDYEVGAYIFPGWKQGVHYGWQRIHPYPEKRPVLGWYKEELPDVADWWIKWALEHGVTFFAYDWYWHLGKRQLEHGLHEAFLNARYQHMMKFSLLWANHNPPIASPEEAEQDLMNVTDYWIEQYFGRPNYLRIDGKPVIFIFSPWHFTNDLKGSDNVKRMLDRMRKRCEEKGVGGLYLVFCISTGRLEAPIAEVERATEEGWDAVSTYAWVGYDRKYIPFSEAAAGYKASWQAVLDSTPLKMIVPISGGFDSRPWHAQPTIRYDRTPEAFRKHLLDAKAVMDRDDRPPGVRMAIVEAWNEWGEGAYIEPNTEWGFGYLDAIRSVFTEAPERHDDVTPRDLGLGPYDWDFTTRDAWEFEREGETGNWGGMMGLAEVRVADGCLHGRTTTRDAAFAVATSFNARDHRYVLVRMRISKGEGGQLFWSGSRVRESEQASVRFELKADNQFHDYLLPVGENRLWRGTITRLRLDPGAEEDAEVAIDFVRLCRDLPQQ